MGKSVVAIGGGVGAGVGKTIETVGITPGTDIGVVTAPPTLSNSTLISWVPLAEEMVATQSR